MHLIPVDHPAQVTAIAEANRLPHTRNAFAASVQLGEVTYFWSAT